MYDHDGDGLYNGTFDWDSGELHAYCETDENNSKIEPNCTTSFVLEFNINWTEGDYAYQDLREDGTSVNATIRLFKDMDSHNASTAPQIGSSFGVNKEEQSVESSDTDEPLTPEEVLLYVAVGTGGCRCIAPRSADCSEFNRFRSIRSGISQQCAEPHTSNLS